MTGVVNQRIDRWLWHARIFRTRSLASRFAASGKIRINGTRTTKPSQTVAIGDVLTFVLHRRLRVLGIAGLAERRGPYQEACLLYEDHSPAPEPDSAAGEPDPAGGPRPTKRNRRRREAFTDMDDDDV